MVGKNSLFHIWRVRIKRRSCARNR